MHGDNGLARYMRGQPLMCSVLVMAGRVVLAATPQSQWFVGHAIMYCLIAGAVRMHAWNKLIPCHHILLNDLRFSGAARTQIQNLVPWSFMRGEFHVSVCLALVFGVETLLVAIMDHLLDSVWGHGQAEVGLLAMLGLEALMNLCVVPGEQGYMVAGSCLCVGQLRSATSEHTGVHVLDARQPDAGIRLRGSEGCRVRGCHQALLSLCHAHGGGSSLVCGSHRDVVPP